MRTLANLLPAALVPSAAQRALSADQIRSRVRRLPDRTEWVFLGLAALLVVINSGAPNAQLDWLVYEGAARGQHESNGLFFYYPYWALPVIELFALFGPTVGYFLWSGANVCGLWFAARVFGGDSRWVLASGFVFQIAFIGNITGLAAAAAAGTWWALHAHRPIFAGLLLPLATVKPQWGVPLAIAMLLVAPVTWRQRFTAIATAATIALWSIANYGWWPPELMDRAAETPPVGNGSLWSLVGPAVAVLWIPVVFAPTRTTTERLTLVLAAAALATPYIQPYDNIVLLATGLSPLSVLSHLRPLLQGSIGPSAVDTLTLAIPAIAYTTILWRGRNPRPSDEIIDLRSDGTVPPTPEHNAHPRTASSATV